MARQYYSALLRIPSEVRLVIFDLAGTTIDDTIDGVASMSIAMVGAFDQQNVRLTLDQVNLQQGKTVLDAIKSLIKEHIHQFPAVKHALDDGDTDMATSIIDTQAQTLLLLFETDI